MTTTRNAAGANAVRTRSAGTLLAAALGFVLCYLSADLVASRLASTALPLPTDPVQAAQDWYAENQLAAVVQGIAQFLSVSALGLFVTRLRTLAKTAEQVSAARRATPWGLVAVGLMMLSSALAWTLAAVAPGASLETVAALRTANFIAGGTAHVVPLGVFVFLASRIRGMSKPIRILAIVAAVPAVLSLISLLWFQGAVLILLGRLLGMIWTLGAAVSIARHLRRGTWG